MENMVDWYLRLAFELLFQHERIQKGFICRTKGLNYHLLLSSIKESFTKPLDAGVVEICTFYSAHFFRFSFGVWRCLFHQESLLYLI